MVGIYQPYFSRSSLAPKDTLHAVSLPSTSAAKSSFPLTVPNCSATASAAGKVDALECTTASICVSPKSSECAMAAFAKAAQAAGSFLPNPITVASFFPPTAFSTANSTNSLQPSPRTAAPSVIPTASRMDFFCVSITACGISS